MRRYAGRNLSVSGHSRRASPPGLVARCTCWYNAVLLGWRPSAARAYIQAALLSRGVRLGRSTSTSRVEAHATGWPDGLTGLPPPYSCRFFFADVRPEARTSSIGAHTIRVHRPGLVMSAREAPHTPPPSVRINDLGDVVSRTSNPQFRPPSGARARGPEASWR